MTGRLSQPLRAPCPLLSEPPMARGAGAPDCLRTWDGKEAFNICTWGPGAWCWGSIRGGRSGLHPEETRALAGRRAPGGAVFLLSGQRPVSAFNCPRLGGAPGIHGRQPRTLPTPPPSACGVLPGPTAHLLLLLPLCGRRRVGPRLGAKSGASSTAHSSSPSSGPDSGAGCVECCEHGRGRSRLSSWI